MERHDIACLSVCGILGARRAGEGVAAFIERLWAARPADATEADAEADAENALPARLYVGSSFCAQSYLAITPDEMADAAKWCAESGVLMTLVVPVFSERLLDAGLAHGRLLAGVCRAALGPASPLDEITVNDLGMFMDVGRLVGEGMPFGLNLGRLFNRDLRDPRDPDRRAHALAPALIRRSWDGVSNLDRLQATWPIRCVEFDPTNVRVDLSDLPDDVEAAVYGPLCYMSTAQICEFASIGAPDEQRFRPNMPCARQCLRTASAYRGASGCEFLKLGRTVYFEAGRAEATGARVLRRIYEPLKEVLF